VSWAVFFLDRGALEDLALSGWEGEREMKKTTYLIVAPIDERKADYTLTMAVCDDRCRCWWQEDQDPTDSYRNIIDTEDEKLLDELRDTGWSVELAPAGVYVNTDLSMGCLVLNAGGPVEELNA